MSITLKSIEQSSETTHWLPHMTGQHAAKNAKTTSSRCSMKELKQIFGKGRGKARCEELHSHLATKLVLWRVVYNGKLRKINACVKGTLHIINILLLYEHYVCVTLCQVHIKGFQLNIQHNNNM